MPLKTKPGRSKKRYAVSRLNDGTIRKKYSKLVVEAVGDKWSSDGGGEKMWEMLSDGVKKSAEKVFGWEKRLQPEWFRDSFVDLKKLISKRNLLFSKWLGTHHHRDRQRYVSQRRKVAHEVKRAKNAWFQEKAQEVKMAICGGKEVWNGLRAM